MNNDQNISRRTVVKSSIFGLLAVSAPNIIYARDSRIVDFQDNSNPDLFHRYPAIDDAIVSEVVGVSHFDLDRLRELVDPRPELARATWDWGFGDWETAIGAASHVGRKDIVHYLLKKGARPDVFTFAMLGRYDTVKSVIEHFPEAVHTAGPHGISLLRHAEIGSSGDVTLTEKDNYARLIDFLKSAGAEENEPVYQTMEEDEKSRYLGDYKYGEGEEEGFSVRLNMRKLLTLGRIGTFGGALYRTGENKFDYNGCPSVSITFKEQENKIISLTIKEPGLELTAKKVS